MPAHFCYIVRMAPPLIAQLIRKHDPERAAISRREALKSSAAAAAAFSLLGPMSTVAQARDKQAEPAKVIVIGAGFSGLSCADRLAAQMCDVTILEAGPRVGGRVLTFKGETALAQNRVVEGGGELIGSNHPTWLVYAKRFGLTLRDVTSEAGDTPVIMNGKAISAKQAEALWEAAEHAFKRMTNDAAAINAEKPWLSESAAALDALSLRAWLEGLGLSDLEVAVLDAQMRADNGVDTPKQSYLANLAAVKGGGLEQYWTESEVYRCAEGNNELALALAKQFQSARSSSRGLFTNAPVNKIERLAATKPGSPRLRVHAAGTVFDADSVVLAVPPTVWKDIEFDVPEELASGPQMGMNVKFLSVLKSKVWLRNGLAPDSLRDGMVNLTWHSTDNQTSRQGDPWVLNAFSGGSDAKVAIELPAVERAARYSGELEELYPGYKEEVIKTRFMDWPGFKYTKASYSFPAPGELMASGAALHTGYDGLHFAGEHCTHAFVGYMEGALQSGIEVADRILETLEVRQR